MGVTKTAKTALYILVLVLLPFVLVYCSTNVNNETGSQTLVPHDVTVVAGAGQITLSWNAVDDGGATKISDFNIYIASQSGVNPSNYLNLSDGRKISVSSSTYTITCLDPNKTYYFVVTSGLVTYIADIPYLVGESSPSAEVSASPEPKSIPSASTPTGLTATAGVNTVTLNWNPNPADECIDSYTVYMASAPWATWAATLPGALQTNGIKYPSFTQEGLDNGTTYWFAVTASNYQGSSSESIQVSATPESLPTSISFDLNGDSAFGDEVFVESGDVMVPGNSRTYKAIIRNQINAPMPGVTVVWSSSNPTIAGATPESGVTDAYGVATTTVSSSTLGSTTITAIDADSSINKSVLLNVLLAISNISGVTSGEVHSCAMTSTGGAICWGDNEWGKLGDGWAESSSDVPVVVVGVENGVRTMASGRSHSCAITLDGFAKCWGFNNLGQLGRDDVLYSAIAEYVMDINEVSDISTGGTHTCAVTATGGLKCWGSNFSGELGDGSFTGSKTPVDVVGLGSGVSAISAGGSHTCAITTAGGVKCWGDNDHGQLGNGTTTDNNTPVDVVGLSSGVVAISAGRYHTCAVTATGGVKCWGHNFFGQVGNGNTLDMHTPVTVVGLDSGVSAVSAGGYHTCVLTTAGGVKCWGNNDHGQLGNGTTTDTTTPVDINGLDVGVTTISAGGSHTCAVTMAGGIKCWGSGGLGDGTTLKRLHPVDVVSE